MAEENKTTEELDTNNNQNEDSSKEDAASLNSDLDSMKKDLEKSKKKSTISKILISVIAFLVFLLLLGTTLYLFGFFTPEKVVEKEPLKNNVLSTENEKENYKFDIKNINSKKLNEQLANLTKKNIYAERNEELERIENEKKILEEQKRKEEEALKAEEKALQEEKNRIEENKLKLENEKIELEAMRQEALLLKEELEANKIKLEEMKQDLIKVEKTTPLIKEVVEEEISNTGTTEAVENINEVKEEMNSFLKLINVAKIKGSLYKKYLDSITSIDTNVILCRDDKNRIEIYFGPFENNDSRSSLLNKLIDNGFDEAYELELTKEEFDKRCNY